ncbi:GGDEF domain-containing protein [Tissierella sp. MSJ-40]|uniref:GGDEF domain-containing protein n=1 Tax=Tissierella simiarum TaxID=2841534 RepID=A0ABS6E2D6_9FIRM|nr:GGDEF domain-containing protein [Tissierella simiarum]MBU5437070.1 GGDEF domain-containing protein [Tissierella simiarum]
MDLINEIKDRLSIFEKFYDVIRIVDPQNKKSISVRGEEVELVEGTCYNYWNKDSFCENCISMKAYLQQDTIVKIEHKQGKIFLVMAAPIHSAKGQYVAEILKDISESGKVLDEVENSNEYVEYVLRDVNEKIIRDGLTKVYNRRYINERLPLDIDNSIANSSPLSIVITDIDRFKKINDEYGHLVGDKILMDFAKILKNSIRKETDWVGRFGGEEFLIVLNNTIEENAYKVAEKLRKHVEKFIFEYDEVKIKVTASFGVCGLQDRSLNIEELIEGADKNLYKAKKMGRNKTIL